jgi:hypothetical protein
VGRTEYEQWRAEYEGTVLHELTRMLFDPKKQAERIERDQPRIRVEDVRLDTSEAEHGIVILFRDLDRPGCLFGWEVDAMPDSDVLDDDKAAFADWRDAAEFYATIIWANWEERIYAFSSGLPEECSSEGINWI